MNGTQQPAPLEGQALVDAALRIATHAHDGQVDKIGRPYLEHPLRVAERVRAAGYDERYVAVALLHDVVEDSDYTAADLLAAGIPAEVVTGVLSLTKTPGEPLPSAIGRAGADPYGKVVKAADVADNTSPDRVAELDEPTRARLEVKYDRTRAILAEHGAPVFT